MMEKNGSLNVSYCGSPAAIRHPKGQPFSTNPVASIYYVRHGQQDTQGLHLQHRRPGMRWRPESGWAQVASAGLWPVTCMEGRNRENVKSGDSLSRK